MNLNITINNTENLGNLTQEKVQEIVTALVRSGGLSGVKAGKTILHFDEAGDFRGIQLDYFPWKKRKT